jgi:DNA-binding transcriptional ArsR family regulator
MVDQQPSLDQTFAALADPTRRQILARLRRGPVNVGVLAEPFDMSLAAVSKHLGVLERAGLIHRETHGRERLCHLRARPLRAASAWTETYRSFWEERLDALDAHPRTRRRRGRRR